MGQSMVKGSQESLHLDLASRPYRLRVRGEFIKIGRDIIKGPHI